MIVNPLIKQALSEIAIESIQYHNTFDPDRKYLKKLLKVYNTDLTEYEQLFVLKFLLEMLHYKNITVDPDNILTIYNIKMRTYFFIFIILAATISIVVLLMMNYNPLSTTFDFIMKFFHVINLG